MSEEQRELLIKEINSLYEFTRKYYNDGFDINDDLIDRVFRVKSIAEKSIKVSE